MPEPKGKLVTPVGFDRSGSVLAFGELSDGTLYTTGKQDLAALLAGNAFSFSSSIKLSAGSGWVNAHLIKNPSGSGKIAVITDLLINASKGEPFSVAFVISPTVTADGTSASTANRTAGSSNTPVIECYDNPTVSGGTWAFIIASPGQAFALQTSLAILPGGYILIKKANSGSVDQYIRAGVMWYEIDE